MSPSFYTGAGNFLSAIQGGVDPRTGLFNVNLPLANLLSGDLAGPVLALALRYSPLGNTDDGFGKGFALNLSRYDRQKRKLFLSTGESYSVSRSENAVLQQKLKSFIFKKTDDPGATYQVIHKSGLTETLTMLDSGAYTTRVTDALGRWLGLSWEWSGTKHRLSGVYEIREGKNSPLCSVSYSDNPERAVTFSVLPDDPDAGYDMVFCIRDGELRSVTSHADIPALVWSFTYGDPDPKWPRYLTGMVSPTGMKQEVLYAYAGSRSARFPDGIGLPSLPRAFGHTLSPGGGQPDVLTRWDWTEENYLGRNLPGHHEQWQPDKDLALMLDLQPGYVYGSTENTLGADKRVIRSVTRRYNSYHLQVSESTLRDGKTYTVATEYHASPGAKHDEQPPQYQLPRRQTEIWQTGSGIRTCITQWQFDTSGNLLAEQLPDGAAVEYLYYPREGESNNCPPDPHGFVRWLKLKVVLPPRIYGDEVRTRTRHYWKKIDSLSEGGYAVLPDRIEATTVLPAIEPGEKGTKRLRTRLSYTYNSDAQDGLAYGRESRLITTRWPDISGSPDECYSQTQVFSYASSSELLTRTATLTTHDGQSLTCYTVCHSVLGYLLSQKDAQDVITKYTRDKLGRILTRTEAAGTAYERTSACEYSISKAGTMVTATDPRGNQTRIFYDAAGREISQQQLDADGPRDNDGKRKWYDVSSRTFTVQGEVGSTYATDWQTDSGTKYALLTHFEYDGFGSPCKQVTSDGVIVSDIVDPVALIRSMKSSGGSLTSATRTTELDPRLLLPQKETIAGGGLEAVRKYKWDGHHRLREVEDENGRITKFTWDDEGRLLMQRLPDDTVVTRTWARHLSGEFLSSISVAGKDGKDETKTWVLGTQTFDGLGRLTKRVSGGRTTVFTYSGASPVPASVTLPSGKTVTYTYIPELGHVVSSMTADGLRQLFSYDYTTGALLTAEEGRVTTENTLFPSGSLKTEKFTQGGTTREAGYVRTLAGAVDTYRDITGKETHYVRNGVGQITNVEDEALTVRLAYDPLGRLSCQVVTEQKTKGILTTALAYDDLGREITRTTTGDLSLKLSQIWARNGQLNERITQLSGEDVCHEHYGYDIRNRLVTYTASGKYYPSDMYGKGAISEQKYKYDALNNLTSVTTILKGGHSDMAEYHYDNSDDPTQLTSVTHTHPDYPEKIKFDYDSDGRVIFDEEGRRQYYDAIGRLTSISQYGNALCRNIYDAFNRLVSQIFDDDNAWHLYYRGTELVNEIQAEEEVKTRRIKLGHACLGVDDGNGIALTVGDQHDSLRLLYKKQSSDSALFMWSPYGCGKSDDFYPGFNGESVDSVSGNYLLGNGYRAYSPVLMRFTSPDSLSPFGGGGINPYAYCAGDPVNITDPSGHVGMPDYFWGVMGAAFSILGLAAALLSGGLAIAAAGGVMAALGAASAASLVAGGLGIASDITALASIALEDSNPAVASAMGWTSMATGIAGMGAMVLRSSMLFGTEKGSIVLGGTMRNLDPRGQDFYFFDDVYKGEKRLNLVAHGALENGSTAYVARTAERNMSADEMFSIISRSKDLGNYKNIRTIMCFSGDGGDLSFGQRLSTLTGIPVKSYRGTVTGNFEVGDLNKLIFEAAAKYGDNGLNHMLAVFEQKRFFVIYKTNPHSLFSSDYWKWNYDPVRFLS
ncbi:RHS repeat-associated core domain-containing protein [Enterobacter hormaechei]|nr:RHS repeat-associated core domain-containing protein [Enterobacter hormaechei]